MVDSVLEVQNIKTTGISPQKDIVTTNSGTGDVTVNGNIVVPDSGTIGSASDTDAITIDSSGNVGIGTDSPQSNLDVASSTGGILTLKSTNIAIASANEVIGQIQFYSSDTSPGNSGVFAKIDAASNRIFDGDNASGMNLRFFTGDKGDGAGSPPERMRIDTNGNVLINTTSTSVGTLSSGYITIDLSAAAKHGLNINSLAENYAAIGIRKHNTSGTSYPLFIINSSNALVGSISMTNSAVAFNTSSDYRLKTDVQPMTGATERLKALNPINFAWKVDGSRVDGFLAHEAQEVVPEAVTGEKDGVDADGNPEYQGIDQAKLVPLLTAALQEAVSKIEALTARIEVLENAAG